MNYFAERIKVIGKNVNSQHTKSDLVTEYSALIRAIYAADTQIIESITKIDSNKARNIKRDFEDLLSQSKEILTNARKARSSLKRITEKTLLKISLGVNVLLVIAVIVLLSIGYYQNPCQSAIADDCTQIHSVKILCD